MRNEQAALGNHLPGQLPERPARALTLAEDDDGLAYLIPVDHIIAAALAGALTVATAFGVFIYRAFIKPSRPRSN